MVGVSAYCFDFKKLQIGTWEDWKTHRQGRLLPPFSTRLQQNYAAYLQRTGLPTIPKILRSVAVPSTGTAPEVEDPAKADKQRGGHCTLRVFIGFKGNEIEGGLRARTLFARLVCKGALARTTRGNNH